MNNVVIIGRLTKDPELQMVGDSSSVARFTVAVDRKMSAAARKKAEAEGKPTADFIRVVAWNGLAETISKYTAKGLQIAVQGKIQTGSYQDKDGKTVYTTDILADTVDFLDWATDQQQQAPQQGQQQQAPQQNQQQNQQQEWGGGFNPVNNDIPF